MAAITDQIKASGDKHIHVSHIKLLQSRMYVINILLLTKRKKEWRVDSIVPSLRNGTCR